MDSLKHVAEKVVRSPQIIRKKLAHAHGHHDHSGHQELREDWVHQEEALADGVPFYVKNLGCCPVTLAQGAGCTDEAVKHIVSEVKKIKHQKQEKLQRLLLTVATKKVTLEDLDTQEIVLDIPIYRISYCTADPNFPKVFAFVCREHHTKNLRCHAFLTSSKEMAQALSLSVADAFNVAYELYGKSKKQKEKGFEEKEQPDVKSSVAVTITGPTSPVNKAPEKSLIQLADEEPKPLFQSTDVTSRKLQALDLATDSNFEEDFTRFAECRSNPNLFETPVRKVDFLGDMRALMASEETAKELRMSSSHNDLFSS